MIWIVRRRSRITLTSSIYGFLFYFLIIWSLGTPKPVFAKLAKLGKIFYSPLKIWTIFTRKDVNFHFFCHLCTNSEESILVKTFLYCIYIVYFSAFHLSSSNCFLEVWAMQCLHFLIFLQCNVFIYIKQCKFWVCTFFVREILCCVVVVSDVRVYACNLLMISLKKQFSFM